MREIKFRAWDTKNKKWTLPLVASSGWTTMVEPYNCRKDTKGNLINIIALQYTGLKDKNGKEIYEGDIVKGVFYKNEPEIGIVEWFEKGARFSIFGYPMNIDGLHDLEITGNIYENPRLLKG